MTPSPQEPTARAERTVEALLEDTDLLLRWGHLPDCGEKAEFPWECTCDWKGSIERIRARLVPAAATERLTRAYTLLISSVPALLRSHRDSPNDVARTLNASLHDAVVDWCIEYQKAAGRGDQGLARLAGSAEPDGGGGAP